MSKKIISLALALVMALGMFSSTVLAADTPSSWAAEQVNKAIAEKLVPQSLQSKYTQATTRAEFCALAVALYENIKGAITGRTTFTDTTDVNVEKAASIGVVSGVGNNRFDPDAKLTREQAAVMLSRLADAVGKPFEKKAATFADNGKVSSWALEGVGQVQAAGIMGGVGNNTFAPKDPYTREQSIITILRTYDAVKGGGTTEQTKPTDPPSGEVNTDLVGNWAGTLDGVSVYYDFRADGTYIYRADTDLNTYNISVDAPYFLIKGVWSVSDGTIYTTKNQLATWSGNSSPPATLNWKSIDDDTTRISFDAEDHRNKYPDERYLYILDVFSSSAYSKPNTYLRLEYGKVTQSWVFPANW